MATDALAKPATIATATTTTAAAGIRVIGTPVLTVGGAGPSAASAMPVGPRTA